MTHFTRAKLSLKSSFTMLDHAHFELLLASKQEMFKGGPAKKLRKRIYNFRRTLRRIIDQTNHYEPSRTKRNGDEAWIPRADR